MNAYVFVCLVACAAVTLALPQNQKYTDRYDNIDLDEIISNNRLLRPYVKCILDQGRCSPDGKELKSHIGEALMNKCAKCTDVQRTGTRKVIGHLINNEPEYWNQISAKYDPEHKYVTVYEDELKTVTG